MFHMLSCFDLKTGVTIEEFSDALMRFTLLMEEIEGIESIGALGKRQRHPIMDTDSERDQEYFFITSFRDREQCDRSVEHIMSQSEPGDTIHKAMNSKITNAVFICWEDH